MGCIASKQSVSVTPAFDYSSGLRLGDGGDVLSFSPSTHRSYTSELGKTQGSKKKKKSSRSRSGGGGSELGLSTREGGYKGGVVDFSVSTRLGNLNKYVEGEQVAAGWPVWLSAVAGEAIQGWIPLRADSFEKLEKIGQGTYSSVFRARDLDNGKIVALKKVRFDNFEPESVRFMAREIMILRRLNHPNIVKLEGLITSRLSCSIYLVFEYMEHDISGLSSCPDIKFSESQVKCYMRQLLSGLEHCHSRGIMHRDIKGSNLLVSNDGILKIADFGLANYINPGNRQPLTSRVVTLWYRPPELLLGSTEYGETVDLWSVGCVFAELFLGKPILQGRTEVEQLHKIFKLCGSPPDEYWKKCKLPHATIFKPQNPYDRSLPVVCKDLPKTALNLIETFLFVEASKRGTAASALVSEYFTTKPYACDPSSLPKYPPNKEIDAKSREEARRKKNGGKTRGNEASRRPAKVNKAFREPNGFSKSVSVLMDFQVDNRFAHKSKGDVGHLPKDNVCLPKPDTDARRNREPLKKPSISTKLESPPTTKAPQEDVPFSGPLQVSTSSGFAWAKRRKEDSAFIRSHSRSSSRNQLSSTIDLFGVLLAKNSCEAKCQGNGEELHGRRTDSESRDSYEMAKLAIRKQWNDFDRAGSFDASEGYHSQEISATAYRKEELGLKGFNLDEEGKVEFSGPLLSQSHRVDELLERNEHHIRQAVRRSWFQKGKKGHDIAVGDA